MASPVISTKNLTIGYRSKQKEIVIQEKLDLDVIPGELICLIGPNGCGKSTLLHTLSGLIAPLCGQVYINNQNQKTLSLHKRAKQMSFVLTDELNIPLMTVYELVSLGRNPYTGWRGNLQSEDTDIIDNSLKQVKLNGFEQRTVVSLSDGEKQRASIAKALAQDTPIILLDEPTAHLDINNRIEILILLARLAHETKKAILLSTHELELALELADNIWLMDNKRMNVGKPDNLINNGLIQEIFHGESYAFDEDEHRFIIKYNH